MLKYYLDPYTTAKEKLRKLMCPQTEDADNENDADANADNAITSCSLMNGQFKYKVTVKYH